MDLPTMEEYFKNTYDANTYICWSEPLFQCPVCKEGKVKRNETEILATYPPKNLYKCFNCGKEFYR